MTLDLQVPQTTFSWSSVFSSHSTGIPWTADITWSDPTTFYKQCIWHSGCKELNHSQISWVHLPQVPLHPYTLEDVSTVCVVETMEDVMPKSDHSPEFRLPVERVLWDLTSIVTEEISGWSLLELQDGWEGVFPSSPPPLIKWNP